MSSGIDRKDFGSGITDEDKGQINKQEKHDVLHEEVLVNEDLMNDAIDGENEEHAMGIWTAVKTHPWACLWAFTMCFTIVSLLHFPALPRVPGFRLRLRSIDRSVRSRSFRSGS